VRRWLIAIALLGSACAPAPSGHLATPTLEPPSTIAAVPTTPASSPTPSSASSPAIPSPVGSATPIPLLSSAFVAAAGDGVVWLIVDNSRLFRSRDFGETWDERLPPPQPINGNIAFVDDRNGWVLTAGSPATGCMAQGFQIWRTTDGAATWQNAYKDTFPPSSGCKSQLAFVDPEHGYISVSSRDARPAVLRTSDSGGTWSRSEVLADPPGFTFSPSGTRLDLGSAVADFGSTLLVSAVGEVSSQYTRYVYRSVDRGRTWSFWRAVPNPMGIVFLTPTRWLQLGLASSGSRETTDAGATWHSVPTDYQQAAGVAPQIAFGDASTGYATVRGSLKRTADGGTHWTSLRTPGT
jgi:photosystem II stability/assembly factor-like uncharacterized protein